MTDASVLEGLTYRPLHGRREMPGIARLFDLAGWGPVDADQLADWFLSDGPLGLSLIMVIANEQEELVGMTMWSPCRVQLFDRIGVATRGRAFVLAPELRRSARGVHMIDDTDPGQRLQQATEPYIDERGWEFTYGLPNPRVRNREELLEVPLVGINSTCEYGLGLRVDIDDEPGGPTPLTVGVADSLTPEYDVLWQRARAGLDIHCAVLRDTSGLAHVRDRQLLLECRNTRSGELLGYAVFLDQRKGKLHDILAVDPDAMRLVARSTVNWLRDHPDEHEIQYFNTVPHPKYRDALVDAGAYEIDWLFSFYVGTHHETPRDELNADAWYVTTGD